MIEFDSVFFDTSPFIYLIENNSKYSSVVADFIADQSIKEILLTTSVITISEFQVNPKKLNNLKPIEDLNRLIDQLSIQVFDITIKNDTVKIFAPVVVGRKGEYYQLLYDLLGKGFEKVKVDGVVMSLREQIILSKNKIG